MGYELSLSWARRASLREVSWGDLWIEPFACEAWGARLFWYMRLWERANLAHKHSAGVSKLGASNCKDLSFVYRAVHFIPAAV